MKKTKDASELSAFERFQDFARKIVAVPKKELEGKLIEYKQRKSRRRKKAGRARRAQVSV